MSNFNQIQTACRVLQKMLNAVSLPNAECNLYGSLEATDQALSRVQLEYHKVLITCQYAYASNSNSLIM